MPPLTLRRFEIRVLKDQSGETTVTLQNLIQDTTALAVGDRLVPIADPVEVFTDPLATDSAGTVLT